jgi:hypothetical protein
MEWIQANQALVGALATIFLFLLHIMGKDIPIVSDFLNKLGGKTAPVAPGTPAVPTVGPPASIPGGLVASHPLLAKAAQFLGSELLGAQAEGELELLIDSWTARALPPPVGGHVLVAPDAVTKEAAQVVTNTTTTMATVPKAVLILALLFGMAAVTFAQEPVRNNAPVPGPKKPDGGIMPDFAGVEKAINRVADQAPETLRMVHDGLTWFKVFVVVCGLNGIAAVWLGYHLKKANT